VAIFYTFLYIFKMSRVYLFPIDIYHYIKYLDLKYPM
jgi:hypothetical protein